VDKDIIIKKITKERGGLANIHRSYEDFPIGMEAHYEFYSKVMLAENLPLNREQREWLAVETSKANRIAFGMDLELEENYQSSCN
jgi:hypothetical protein